MIAVFLSSFSNSKGSRKTYLLFLKAAINLEL